MYWQILTSLKALKKPTLTCLVKGHTTCGCGYKDWNLGRNRCPEFNILCRYQHCEYCGWIILNKGNWVKIASKYTNGESLDMRHPEPYCGYFVVVYRKDIKDDITYYVEAGSSKQARALVQEMVEQTISKKEYTVLKCGKNI